MTKPFVSAEYILLPVQMAHFLKNCWLVEWSGTSSLSDQGQILSQMLFIFIHFKTEHLGVHCLKWQTLISKYKVFLFISWKCEVHFNTNLAITIHSTFQVAKKPGIYRQTIMNKCCIIVTYIKKALCKVFACTFNNKDIFTNSFIHSLTPSVRQAFNHKCATQTHKPPIHHLVPVLVQIQQKQGGLRTTDEPNRRFKNIKKEYDAVGKAALWQWRHDNGTQNLQSYYSLRNARRQPFLSTAVYVLVDRKCWQSKRSCQWASCKLTPNIQHKGRIPKSSHPQKGPEPNSDSGNQRSLT